MKKNYSKILCNLQERVRNEIITLANENNITEFNIDTDCENNIYAMMNAFNDDDDGLLQNQKVIKVTIQGNTIFIQTDTCANDERYNILDAFNIEWLCVDIYNYLSLRLV